MSGEGYMVMKSLLNYMQSFVPKSCSTGLGGSDAAKPDSLVDLFRFYLKTFEAKEAL